MACGMARRNRLQSVEASLSSASLRISPAISTQRRCSPRDRPGSSNWSRFTYRVLDTNGDVKLVIVSIVWILDVVVLYLDRAVGEQFDLEGDGVVRVTAIVLDVVVLDHQMLRHAGGCGDRLVVDRLIRSYSRRRVRGLSTTGDDVAVAVRDGSGRPESSVSPALKVRKPLASS